MGSGKERYVAMKKSSIAISSLALLALTACGRSYQGTYRGTETLVTATNAYNSGYNSGYGTGYGQPTSTNGATSQTLTISLNDVGNESVTGSFTSSTHSGTIQGQVTGSGLANVVFNINTVTTSSQQNYGTTYSPYGNYYPYGTYGNTTNTTSQYGCSGSFTGNLSFSNNRLSGTLNAMNTQSANNCGISSIGIDVQK